MNEYITYGLREQNKTAYDWLWLAQCIAVDYDGCRTEKGLMGLVDELAAYIREARTLLDKQRAEDIKEFAEKASRDISAINHNRPSDDKEDIIEQALACVDGVRFEMLSSMFFAMEPFKIEKS